MLSVCGLWGSTIVSFRATVCRAETRQEQSNGGVRWREKRGRGEKAGNSRGERKQRGVTEQVREARQNSSEKGGIDKTLRDSRRW
jgi:hypothetical protein